LIQLLKVIGSPDVHRTATNDIFISFREIGDYE
jgi:hypothetical protein